MKSLLFFSCLLISTAVFSQKFGTILVSDYDDPTLSVEGVSVYFGKELLGTTDHVGSFHFPKKIRGKVTLSHPNYVSRELAVKTKEKLVIDTNLMMTQHAYDSVKAVFAPIVYQKCIKDEVRPIPLTSTSTISLQAFSDYVESMKRYPKRSRDAGTTGTVELRFRISETGLVNCVEITEGTDYELDKEAFRILASMPQWTPAKRNGVPVEAVYAVSITFNR
jgi:TonB family protein